MHAFLFHQAFSHQVLVSVPVGNIVEHVTHVIGLGKHYKKHKCDGGNDRKYRRGGPQHVDEGEHDPKPERDGHHTQVGADSHVSGGFIFKLFEFDVFPGHRETQEGPVSDGVENSTKNRNPSQK